MKNISNINKKVATELGISEDIISKVNDFYWNTVKQELRNLDNEFIHIKKIGDFEVSQTKLNHQIVKIRQFIYNIRRSKKFTETKKEEIIKDYKLKYVKCLRMKEEVARTLNFRNTYKKCSVS